MTPITLLLQAAPDQNFGLRMMLNFALIIPIFYFLLIRPQMKERKRHEKMVEGVKKGVTVDRGRVASGLEEKDHLNMRSEE